ncbi:hypothetical protein NESM_000119200 [Novymonas esmeraldas]|uniref:Uncharacterized protein n=1 Tax=Novymonas esmeraldas TaxID=1808958 RepID=A0AAW0F5P9_9TRYP
MRQETVCAAPVELLAVSDTGASSSKGACVCAIVALPARPPKYSLVCYDARQTTFCVARLGYVDGHSTSLNLLVHASPGHISFSDDVGQRWSATFVDAAQRTRFVACCGAALYTLCGAPAVSVFSHDLSPPSSSLRLDMGDTAHMSFAAYELSEANGLCGAGAAGQQRGDMGGGQEPPGPPYVFRPKSSAAHLTQGCIGFEGSVVGMREDDVRVFVIPAGLPTRTSDTVTHIAERGAVVVARLMRVEHTREEDAGHGRDAPPSVYAPDDGEGQAAAPLPSDKALVVVPTPTPTRHAVTSASSAPAFLSASGIATEHMSVLRKVELGVNAAAATARDVHDVSAIFTQDWHRFMERPKPSLLSHRALLEQVQRVVSEDEAAQEHLDSSNRTLQALEARGKELQQRIDRAMGDSQRLLEDKANAATSAMEARLERDRQLVRLKDTLLLRRQEQDDVQRHIAALQRTVDASNEELRQVQGRLDVHQVEATSMAERLVAMEESLSDERRRNSALVAKSTATEEAICKAQAQHRLADGQLTAARGLAERERLRYLQVMEEERHHRAADADLLRHDIVEELDTREAQFHVDRRRLAEEHFTRGLRDGRAEGRQAAAADVQGHQDELRLNLQRAKTAVETHKEEMRRSIEAAMALRRTLGSKASELEAQLASATRRQTRLQFALAQWQTRCRTARDTVSQHWRALLSYATHPCTREEALAMLEAVRAAEEASCVAGDGDDDGGDGESSAGADGPVRVDLQFQQECWRRSRARSVEQRVRWVSEDMFDLFAKGATHHFHHEWLLPLDAAHENTLETAAQLHAHHHGSRALFDLAVAEARARWALRLQWSSTMEDIETWLAAQRTAQDAVRADEAAGRKALWAAYVAGGEAVVQLCAAQLRAQVALLHRELQERDALESEERQRRKLLPEEARQQWTASCLAALRLLAEAEEAARAGVEAEAYTSHSGLQFQFSYALRGAQQLEEQHAAQQQLLVAETAARQSLVREAAAAAEAAAAQWRYAAPTDRAADAPAPVEVTTPSLPLPEAAQENPAPPPPPPPSSPPHSDGDGGAATSASPATAPSADVPDSPRRDAAAVGTSLPSTDAPRHADPSPPSLPPPPPPPPPRVPASFGFADPPRAALDDHRSRGGTGAGQQRGHGGAATGLSSIFSSEPPPLPPPDDDDDASAESVGAPPLPVSTEAPPGRGGGGGSGRRSTSPSEGGTSSSSTPSLPTAASQRAPTPPPALPPPAAAAAAAPRRPPRDAFGGGGSSDSDEEDTDSEDAPRRVPVHASARRPPSAPSGAAAKPRLFNSSSSSEEEEEATASQ